MLLVQYCYSHKRSDRELLLSPDEITLFEHIVDVQLINILGYS